MIHLSCPSSHLLPHCLSLRTCRRYFRHLLPPGARRTTALPHLPPPAFLLFLHCAYTLPHGGMARHAQPSACCHHLPLPPAFYHYLRQFSDKLKGEKEI